MGQGVGKYQTDRNPDHQQIHHNFIHRTYLIPRKLHFMKVISDPSCTLCTLKTSGTFLHMTWECPPVAQFWQGVAAELTALISETVPVTIPVLLLNDLSALRVPVCQKHVMLACLTAAKKIIAVRWKPSHTLTIRQWVLTFLDVTYMELSTARINEAKEAVVSVCFLHTLGSKTIVNRRKTG